MVNDLVERQGIPVFDNIDTALECATKAIKHSILLEDLTLKDGAKPVRHADLQIGERIGQYNLPRGKLLSKVGNFPELFLNFREIHVFPFKLIKLLM